MQHRTPALLDMTNRGQLAQILCPAHIVNLSADNSSISQANARALMGSIPVPVRARPVARSNRPVAGRNNRQCVGTENRGRNPTAHEA